MEGREISQSSETTVAHLLSELRKLSDNDYKEFLYNAVDQTRSPEVNRQVMKKMGKIGKRNQKINPYVRLSGADHRSADASRPSSLSKSAWNTPFIYRGDLAGRESNLFFDVEKISLKIKPGQSKHQSVAETIAEDKNIVFWCFVKWPEEEICQLFAYFTNLTKDKISMGIEIDRVRDMLKLLLDGNTLVGYDLQDDLKSIGINHNEVDDLTEYFSEYKAPIRTGCKPSYVKYSLKDVAALAATLFPDKDFQCSVHSAVSDAPMTRDLWKKRNERLAENPTENTFQGKALQCASE